MQKRFGAFATKKWLKKKQTNDQLVRKQQNIDGKINKVPESRPVAAQRMVAALKCVAGWWGRSETVTVRVRGRGVRG